MCRIVSYDQLQDELLPWSGADMDQNCGNRQKKLEHAGIFYNYAKCECSKFKDMHTQSVTHCKKCLVITNQEWLVQFQ